MHRNMLLSHEDKRFIWLNICYRPFAAELQPVGQFQVYDVSALLSSSSSDSTIYFKRNMIVQLVCGCVHWEN